MAVAVTADSEVDVEPQSTSQSYNILVTGVTGHGKSALIAGLSGNIADSTTNTLVSVDTKEITPAIVVFLKKMSLPHCGTHLAS